MIDSNKYYGLGSPIQYFIIEMNDLDLNNALCGPN